MLAGHWRRLKLTAGQEQWVLRRLNKRYNEIARITALRNYRQAEAQGAALAKRFDADAHFTDEFPAANPANTVYVFIFSQVEPSTALPITFRFQTAGARRLARVALALAKYHARYKTFPNNLQQLHGGYLTAIPLDPFTGKALIYRRTPRGCALQSAGPGGTHRHPNRWKRRHGLLVRLPN